VAKANGFSIFSLIRYLKAELLLVLGTSSSEAALPSLIEKLEKAGCPKSVVGLVVPLGYSFNLDGTNIYMTLAALFIAQATGVHLSLGDQALLLGVAMLSSKGAAGVTGAGFITLAATLSVVPSVPVAGMALILGVDRFMSECRALTNFIGQRRGGDRRLALGKGPRRRQLEAGAQSRPGRRSTNPSWTPRGPALGIQPRRCQNKKIGELIS
jgi:aerobic C4-dicarboxylate transport protein